jgi:hypothetical protein
MMEQAMPAKTVIEMALPMGSTIAPLCLTLIRLTQVVQAQVMPAKIEIGMELSIS